MDEALPELQGEAGRRRHVSPYRQFDNDCRRNKLAPVVFIDPNSNAFRSRPGGSNNDDQAPADVVRGQEFVGEVYETLRKHGQLANTLFVVTYDEHGGFYDHVPPDPVPQYAQLLDPSYITSACVFQRSSSRRTSSRVGLVRDADPSLDHELVLLRFCPTRR